MVCNLHTTEPRATARTAVSRPFGSVVFSFRDTDGRVVMRWQDIENEKEKYAAYLCSREWSELKEAVKKRSGGTCERCRVRSSLRGTSVRSSNDERRFQAVDLQNIYTPCHEFTHAKSDFDPDEHRNWLCYVRECVRLNRSPIPDFVVNCDGQIASKNACLNAMCYAIELLFTESARYEQSQDSPFENSDGQCELYEIASRLLDAKLPFAFALWIQHGRPACTIDYSSSCKLFG